MKLCSFVFLVFVSTLIPFINCKRSAGQNSFSIISGNNDSLFYSNVNETPLQTIEILTETQSENNTDSITMIRYLLDLRTLPKDIDSIRYYYFGPKLIKENSTALDSVKVYLQKGNVSTLKPGADGDMSIPYFHNWLSIGEYYLDFADFNFDLNQDIAITTWASGGSGNAVNDIYLFNPITEDFKFSSALSKMASIYLNSKRKLVGSRPTGGGYNDAIFEYLYKNENLMLISSVKDEGVEYNGEFKVIRNVQHEIDGKTLIYNDTLSDFLLPQDASDFHSVCRAVDHIRWEKVTMNSPFGNEVMKEWSDKIIINIQRPGYLYMSPRTQKKLYLEDIILDNKIIGVRALELENKAIIKKYMIEIYNFNPENLFSQEDSLVKYAEIYEDFDSILYIFFRSKSTINYKGKMTQCNHPLAYNLSKEQFE